MFLIQAETLVNPVTSQREDLALSPAFSVEGLHVLPVYFRLFDSKCAIRLTKDTEIIQLCW